MPDSDNQLTSDHGWDLSGDTAKLVATIRRYQAVGARVSLFMDPDLPQIERAAAIRCRTHRTLYRPLRGNGVRKHGVSIAPRQRRSVRNLRAARPRHATAIGLGVNAGHDLDLVNLPLFRAIHEVLEVSIGHALIGDALRMGLARAVTAYLEVLRK